MLLVLDDTRSVITLKWVKAKKRVTYLESRDEFLEKLWCCVGGRV